MSARVDVIVPMWNSAATIARTLASLQDQTEPRWQAIIVNDGSTDRGAAIAERYVRADSRFRLLSQPNAGLSAARNTGLRHASAPFVHFLDADDALPPHALAMLLEAAHDTGAACGAFDWISPLGERFRVEPSWRVVGLSDLLDRNRFPVHAQLIARELIGAETFDPSLDSAEDWDLWLRLAAKGVRWTAVEQSVAEYHMHAASMSRDYARMAGAMRRVVQRAFDAARRGASARVDVSPERERAACARIAVECATGAAAHSAAPDARPLDLLASIAPQRAEITPQLLADSAYWTLPIAFGRSPDAWRDLDPSWPAILAQLWSPCEHRAWSEPGAADAALELLAERIVAPEVIVDELVALTEDAPIELIGLGQNGRRLARRLADHPAGVTVRDDAIAERDVLIAGRRFPVQPVDAPFSPGSAVIVTPESDELLLSRLPGAVTPLRWCAVRRRLAAARLQRLRAGMDAAAGASVEGRAA